MTDKKILSALDLILSKCEEIKKNKELSRKSFRRYTNRL